MTRATKYDLVHFGQKPLAPGDLALLLPRHRDTRLPIEVMAPAPPQYRNLRTACRDPYAEIP